MDTYREQRLKKLEEIRKKRNPYPNDFKPEHLICDLVGQYTNKEPSFFENLKDEFVLAGRVLVVRDFGKSAFLSLQDRSGKLQVYIGRQFLGADDLQEFQLLDTGDIVGIKGHLFKTKTGELTLKALSFKILVKSLLPLPEKFHGLTDVEMRFRQRYVDLIVNPEVRKKFEIRSRAISFIRNFFLQRDYMEVETPMMQPICGGATAKPFETHHNALDMKLYLRVAPELYLKRLVVGGCERVFELNRNFRNEGLSAKHNPEFTMLEFYQAYATYEDLMNLTEELISSLVKSVCGKHELTYEENCINFKPPFQRVTVQQAVEKYVPEGKGVLSDLDKALKFLKSKGVKPSVDKPTLGDVMMDLFDAFVEEKLVQPTFVTKYPIEVSPLSRRNDTDPRFVDRFELYMCGREMANAFSELNDPLDQKQRFLDQVKEKREGMAEVDEDYIRALEYGLPPTAGEGIGIDRLIMILTDSHNIREVIFFPHLKREKG